MKKILLIGFVILISQLIYSCQSSNTWKGHQVSDSCSVDTSRGYDSAKENDGFSSDEPDTNQDY